MRGGLRPLPMNVYVISPGDDNKDDAFPIRIYVTALGNRIMLEVRMHKAAFDVTLCFNFFRTFSYCSTH